MATAPQINSAYLTHITKQLPANIALNDFIACCGRPLRRSIRVNTLAISVGDFLKRSASYDWQLSPIPWCANGFWIDGSNIDKLGNHPDHLLGLFYIQEASSMLPPEVLNQGSQGAQKVLDMAAAPGSKTTQLAALLGNNNCIIANELSASRLKSLHANLTRCGVSNTALTHFDARFFSQATPEMFDWILLDAPCGGEGTVRKDPKALSNWSLNQVLGLAKQQKELISAAFEALAVGGSLVYSTCTLSEEENEQVADFLLARFPGQVKVNSLATLFSGADKALTKQGYLKVWPTLYDSEGFFVAKFTKTASCATATKQNKLGQFPFRKLNAKELALLNQETLKQFAISFKDYEARLWLKDNKVWLFPDKINDFIGKLKMDRIGINVATLHKTQIRLSYEFAKIFGRKLRANTYHCSASEANAYINGKDFHLHNDRLNNLGDSNIVLLIYDGYPLGTGKNIRGKLKNNLPRDLVHQGQFFLPKEA